MLWTVFDHNTGTVVAGGFASCVEAQEWIENADVADVVADNYEAIQAETKLQKHGRRLAEAVIELHQ